MTQPGYKSVVILGAGLQGSCVALELARRGMKVVLLDQDEIPMNRASLRNEGKIHLGLVYANDGNFATASLILHGALHFNYLLARWLGSAVDQLNYSTPFNYLVANDSLLTVDDLVRHYSVVESEYHRQLAQHPQLDYLGKRPDRIYRLLGAEELGTHFRLSCFQAGFQTPELAVDPDQLAILIRQAIHLSAGIQFLPSRQVKKVERANGIFRIEGTGPEGIWKIEAQQVVNATWESRLTIDRSIGLESLEGWVHRLKYRVIARLPESLRGAPSVTMVIGRYGDVVIRSNGTVYLSWYPLALQGWSHDLQPPSSWDAPCRGQVSHDEAWELAANIREAIDSWFPGIRKSEPLRVDAGTIFAYGHTDVDHRNSGLHNRTKIGVTSVDGYHSVNTGKLTTAPLFAMSTADEVMKWMSLNKMVGRPENENQ